MTQRSSSVSNDVRTATDVAPFRYPEYTFDATLQPKRRNTSEQGQIRVNSPVRSQGRRLAGASRAVDAVSPLPRGQPHYPRSTARRRLGPHSGSGGPAGLGGIGPGT